MRYRACTSLTEGQGLGLGSTGQYYRHHHVPSQGAVSGTCCENSSVREWFKRLAPVLYLKEAQKVHSRLRTLLSLRSNFQASDPSYCNQL